LWENIHFNKQKWQMQIYSRAILHPENCGEQLVEPGSPGHILAQQTQTTVAVDLQKRRICIGICVIYSIRTNHSLRSLQIHAAHVAHNCSPSDSQLPIIHNILPILRQFVLGREAEKELANRLRTQGIAELI
jgi:hypothetical protein